MTEDFVRAVVMLQDVLTVKVALQLFHFVWCLESPVMVSILDHAPDHGITEAVILLAVPVVIMVLVVVVKVVLVLVEVVMAMA